MELASTLWTSKTPEKAKIILLHGMGGTGSIWRPIAIDFEDEFTILAPDQRGHGGSQQKQSSYGPEDFGQDVVETMAAKNFHPAWVIGHSMGARTACAVSKLKPEWVAGLVIIDLGFQGLAGGGFGENLSKLLRSLPMRFEKRDEAKAYLQKYSPDPVISMYLMAVSRPEDPKNLSGAIYFPFDREALLSAVESARNTSLRPWIKTLGENGVPTLILRGAISRIWSHEDYLTEKKMFEPYPSVQFEEFEGAGHGLPFEKRKEFVARIRDFILLGK